MAAKKRAAILFTLATIVASSSAFASIPRSTVLDPPPIETAAIVPQHDPPLITAHGYDAFLPANRVSEEVARLEKTRVWGSRVGAELLRLPESGLSRALRQSYAKASSENAEEIRDLAISDLYLVASEESKTKLLTGWKSAPFVEPATGLALFRNRWYDPGTGSWLTPDAESYAAGSSNLYAGFNGDPVNNVDPDGNEPVTATAVLAYLGWTTLNTVVDTGIDYGFHAWLGDGEFNWGKSFGTNFAVNFATGSIGGKLAKARHLTSIASPLLRRAAGEGVEYAADVAVTGTIEKIAYGQSNGEAYGSAAVGGAVGRGVGYGAQRGMRWMRQSTSFDDVAAAAAQGLNEGIGEAATELSTLRFSIVYIGKVPDLHGLRPELTLLPELPNLGTPKANYYQNISVLRRKLREGYEVFDRSKLRLNTDPDPTPGNLTRTIGQSFLGAERNQLVNRGLKLNLLTGRYE